MCENNQTITELQTWKRRPKKRKGGAQKTREKKRKALEAEAATSKKISQMFSARPGAGEADRASSAEHQCSSRSIAATGGAGGVGLRY